MTEIAPEHRVVLIRIPRTAPADEDPLALYEATRQWWRIGELRTDGGPASPTHALAVLRGHVVAAYEIESWMQRPADRRWSFTGGPASGAVASYVGADVRQYFPQGAANPIRFVNCDVSATTSARTRELEVAAAAPARSVASDVAALVARIDAEPLAHVMFGHRELFHSNLLAWFFEALPDAADRVFGADLPASEQTERTVQRERQHLDLVMTMPGRERLVIENKVFSVYDAQQLEDYCEVAASWAAKGQGASRLVLFSMLDPREDPAWQGGTFPCDGNEWHYLSYDVLASRIREALVGVEQTYEVQTMLHYADLVQNLSQLVRSIGVQSLAEPVALPSQTLEALGRQQLAGSLVKLRARHVAQLVGAALASTGVEGTVASGYTNTQPLVDWFTDVIDETGTVVTAGWQLQGSDFRRCLIVEHLSGRTPELREQRYEYAAAHEEWFDFSVTDGILGTAETPIAPVASATKRQGFNRYDPDFVYRSKKVPDVTVQQVIDAAVAVAASLT